jgi:hypothetical protein
MRTGRPEPTVVARAVTALTWVNPRSVNGDGRLIQIKAPCVRLDDSAAPYAGDLR